MIGTLQSGSPFGVTVLNGPTNLLGDNSDGTILRANLVSGPTAVRFRQRIAGGGRARSRLVEPGGIHEPGAVHLRQLVAHAARKCWDRR